MRLALLLLLSLCARAATLVVDPPVIYDCNGTVGKATVRWQGASGPVQVLVGPSKVVFTGFGGTSGAAETGVWVSEGLEFFLSDQRGEIEAVARAKVQCNTTQAPANGLVSESYFPLDPGNTWIYRIDSRAGTAGFVTWTVAGLRTVEGRSYSEITSTVQNITSVALLLREERGSFFRWTGTRDELYFNPAAAQHAPFRNESGSYPDAASHSTTQGALIRESQTFVRGVGLARSRADSLTGSSGGFVSGLELVEFRLASGPRVKPPKSETISLSLNTTLLNVTGKQVDNCAIPCYFPACGLGSPVDPPGTYKPCVRTRIEASAEGSFETELALIGTSGEIYKSPAQTGSGENVRYFQLPLYGEGNKPFASGPYILVARLNRGGLPAGQAQLMLYIQ